MSILPLELRKTSDAAAAATEIDRALRSARRRIARRETLVVAASTLAIPIGAAALWIAVSRFTLISLPQWPVLLFMTGWFVLLAVVALTHHISVGRCARYLDRTLSMDERLSTVLELARSTPLKGLSAKPANLPDTLLQDTAFQIKARRHMLPGIWNLKMQGWQGAAIAVTFLLLIGSLFVPTSLDQVRAEQAALQRTVDNEIAQLSALKAEIVSRPGLTDADRKAITNEIDQITASLSTPGLDQSGMLAALSDAQEKLQQLSPQTSADFNNIIAAARTMQQAMQDASQNKTGNTIDVAWSPEDFPGQSDLAIAANAASTLGNQTRYLGSTLTSGTISQLSRASSQVGSDDANLSQNLLDASNAISAKDVTKAKDALQQASQAFAADDQRWQLAQSVDKVMSNLDQGRQSLAELGTTDTKKKQVGFRTPSAPPPSAAQVVPGSTPANGSQGNQNDPNNQANGTSSNSPSALGPQIGGSSPDYSSYKSGNTANGGSASQGGNQANSQTANGTGGQPGSQSSGGGGSAGDGSQGTLTGPITGPVGGGAGAISQVPNPSGQGITTGSTSQASGGQQDDSIYVPPTPEPSASGNSSVGSPGQSAPEQPGAIAGRNANGGDGATTPSDPGEGARNQIHTPYKQVIGNYVQQAAQALDSVYIPADAKDYVKNYFSALGK